MDTTTRRNMAILRHLFEEFGDGQILSAESEIWVEGEGTLVQFLEKMSAQGLVSRVRRSTEVTARLTEAGRKLVGA